MNMPVERPGSKRGVTSFTRHAVQRAMDAKAAKWGAPAGYYTVEDRAAVLSNVCQVWRVRVRLFGGSVHHLEDILFSKDGDHWGGVIQYGMTYGHYINNGGRPVEFFKLSVRYPTTSLDAAARWEGTK